MKRSVDLVYKMDALLGEAPLWKSDTQSLYWVDILNKKLYRLDEPEGNHHIYDMPSLVSCFAFGNDGLIYLFLEDGLYAFEEEIKKLTFISAPEDLDNNHRFNDGKCDSHGRFYVGSMEKDYIHPTGSLYFVDETLKFTKVIHEKFVVPNGLCWNDVDKKFYHVDTVNGDVNVYDYNPISGLLGESKTIIHFEKEEGSPDGMTIDADGKLWIAHWGGYKISRWDPVLCIRLEEIAIPVEKVTSLTFGGKDMKELYITSASLEGAVGELSGSVFKVRVDVEGRESATFKVRKLNG